MKFSELGLSEKVQQAVAAAGYDTPTPIQAQAIPVALEGRDVLGIAQTGTGKTAAFTLPMLSRLESGRARARMPRTLILEPTRELAAQVEEAFIKYGVNHRLNVALLIGGVSFGDQETKIQRGADVLIATPGRLLDFFERGKLLLNGIEILVIDEADRMLDMGFIPDIERICKMVPAQRQTLFFSATMPPEITRLTEQFLREPARIEVARAATTAATIRQAVVPSPSGPMKRETLRRVIRSEPALKNAIIFCNRKRDVAVLHRSLVKHGFSAGALHGDMDQMARIASLDAFKQGDVQLLVCSDVAARGLDIPDVSHVFNFDVPVHADDYVHRIGRTGRAGKSGTAYTIATEDDARHLSDIEKLTRQTIERLDPPVSDEEAANAPRYERRERSGRPTRGGRDRDRSREGRRERAPRPEGERAARPERSERSDRPERAERPERGPRPERAERAERPPREERAARESPPPSAPRPPRETEPRRERGERGDRRPRRDREDDAPVIGFGDHMPGFLMRPVKTN
ncbi:MAG: DEAD/DEAH box helicase [Methylobacteriaceae bacterium]|nr:DEAD/DEAH box helicase [Methylobacteriaceae bacterium]